MNESDQLREELVKQKFSEEKARREYEILAAINTVFRETISCETEEQLAKTCLAVAEEITNAKFGFIGEINQIGRFDTIALSNPGWDACQLENSEKTKLINNMEIRGIWGKVLKDGCSLIVNEPYAHPDSVGTPEGHPPLTSYMGVPLKHAGKTFGMISLGNKEDGFNKSDQEAIESLSIAIVESLRGKRNELRLNQQSQEILEISTPVMQIWEGIVVAPIIGTLDSQRTQRFMECLLNSIVESNSPVALVDITGVPTIDTQTAQHLIETITAAGLLGARVILTGVQPSIAQTLVHLGIDLSDVDTRSSLAAGLKMALDYQGFSISQKEKS